MDVKEVNVADIIVSDIAIRKEDTKNPEYQGLVKSIQDRIDLGLPPLINPITIRRQKNADTGKEDIILIAGLQRLTAHKELKIPTIIANDRGEISNFVAMQEQYMENKHRVKQAPAQEGKHFLRMIAENPDLTAIALAKNLGLTTDYIMTRLKLASDLCEEAQVLVTGKGTDGITIAKAKALASIQDKEEQKSLLADALAMDQAEFIKLCLQRAKEIRAAMKTGKKPVKSEFEPTVKLRKKADLERELEKKEVASATYQNPKQQEAFLAGIAYALSMDEATQNRERQKWEMIQAEKERAKAKKMEEMAKKKAQEAAKKAEELQEEFSK